MRESVTVHPRSWLDPPVQVLLRVRLQLESCLGGGEEERLDRGKQAEDPEKKGVVGLRNVAFQEPQLFECEWRRWSLHVSREVSVLAIYVARILERDPLDGEAAKMWKATKQSLKCSEGESAHPLADDRELTNIAPHVLGHSNDAERGCKLGSAFYGAGVEYMEAGRRQPGARDEGTGLERFRVVV